MLSISHAATGAFIAVKVTNPLLSIPLILATHYLLDAVPHWDAGTGLTKKTITPRQAFLQEIPDLILAGVLILALYPSTLTLLSSPSLTLQNTAPLWGGFLALFPDFLEAPRNFLHFEPIWLKPINRFHHSFHHSIPKKLAGLLPQFLLLWLIWLFH
ncbi:MAG: hypothetical protein ABII80_03985 [bacterium]